MIGSIIGGALKVGGAIAGNIAAGKAMRKVRDNIASQRRENRDWFNRRYNEDATQMATAQRILTHTGNVLRERNRQAAGTAAVMGGSSEGVAAAKAAATDALANATSQIAVSGDGRRDRLEGAYRSTDAALQDRLNDMEVQRGRGIGQAVQNIGNVAGDFDWDSLTGRKNGSDI